VTISSRSLTRPAGPAASAVLIMLLAVWPGPASAGETPRASENETTSTFTLRCSSCHGRDGAGDTPIGKTTKAADLRSPEVQKQSDAQLSQIIADGRKNMPSFSNSLTQDQIRALVAYIRKLSEKKHPTSK